MPSRIVSHKLAALIPVKIRILDMMYANRHPTNYWALLAREKEFLCTFKLSMHLILILRSNIQMQYILVITSIHFSRFFKILEVMVIGTMTVIGEATLRPDLYFGIM